MDPCALYQQMVNLAQQSLDMIVAEADKHPSPLLTIAKNNAEAYLAFARAQLNSCETIQAAIREFSKGVIAEGPLKR
ncbi:MAG TPA: hypothetical protein VHY79_15570 [Rhizomicrobium sp.]|nr:hypothetical protein [Rhizomicrobium sp.]